MSKYEHGSVHGIKGISGDSSLKESMEDRVNHPKHYKAVDRDGNPIESIQVIEAFKLGFNLGNVIKYILRADRKYLALEDLHKARWYLNREIENREQGDV